jgi:hypothetical protein
MTSQPPSEQPPYENGGQSGWMPPSPIEYQQPPYGGQWQQGNWPQAQPPYGGESQQGNWPQAQPPYGGQWQQGNWPQAQQGQRVPDVWPHVPQPIGGSPEYFAALPPLAVSADERRGPITWWRQETAGQGPLGKFFFGFLVVGVSPLVVGAYLLTPIGFLIHLLAWSVSVLWFGLIRACGATGRSRYRAFRPDIPQFPQFWTLAYWADMPGNVFDAVFF